MSNVLVLSLVFPPDSVSTAEIMADLAVDLLACGHTVTVLTTVPHYNPDPLAQERQPLQPFWGRLLQRSEYHGIHVYHAAIPRKTASVAGRLIGWLGFHVVSTIAGICAVPKPDVLLVPSPPLSIGLSAWLIAWFRRARFVYNVQEIYPDIAVNLGAVKNPTVIRLLELLERFVYGRAAAVTVIASRMRRRLLEKGVPEPKVRVISNFVDLDRLAPVPQDNDFARGLQLQGTFSVTYAGNMGPAQGLDTVIEAARLIGDEGTPIRFVLIGEGTLRERLATEASRLPRANVLVLPYQPNSLMPQIYGASDISLVPQAAATGSDAIPSKVYRIMASARPVVAITEHDSDLAMLVRDAECGVVVSPGDAEELARVISDAARHPQPWRQMGTRGHAYVAAHYSRRIVSRQYDALIRSLAPQPRDAEPG